MKRRVQKSDLEKAKKKPFGECQQMTVFDFIGISEDKDFEWYGMRCDRMYLE